MWDAVRDSDAVAQIVAPYGLTPDAEDTPAMHEEAQAHAGAARQRPALRPPARPPQRLPVLAHRRPLGVQTAHFRRPQLDAFAAAKLVHQPRQAQSERVSHLNWDVERRPARSAGNSIWRTSSQIDGSVLRSPQKLLGDKSLADITGDTRSVRVTAPVDDVGDLKSRGEGSADRGGFLRDASAARPACTRSAPCCARMRSCELQGAGTRHSGPYFVASVRH